MVKATGITYIIPHDLSTKVYAVDSVTSKVPLPDRRIKSRLGSRGGTGLLEPIVRDQGPD